jgi:hypothetical protein
MAVIVYYSWTLFWPAMQSNRSFAAFYTAARIFVYQPENQALAYDNAWFGEQLVQAGFPEIHDIFNLNPPVLGLLFTPLLLLPVSWGRIIWVLLSLLSLSVVGSPWRPSPGSTYNPG